MGADIISSGIDNVCSALYISILGYTKCVEITDHFIQNTVFNVIDIRLDDARDDRRLVSEFKADPGQCVSGLRPVCVQSSSCEFLLCTRPMFALRPPSVHTERGRRAFCVHCAFTPRSPFVNAAFTLRSFWFFRKWATLNAGCTLSADWVHATEIIRLRCTVHTSYVFLCVYNVYEYYIHRMNYCVNTSISLPVDLGR